MTSICNVLARVYSESGTEDFWAKSLKEYILLTMLQSDKEVRFGMAKGNPYCESCYLHLCLGREWRHVCHLYRLCAQLHVQEHVGLCAVVHTCIK